MPLRVSYIINAAALNRARARRLSLSLRAFARRIFPFLELPPTSAVSSLARAFARRDGTTRILDIELHTSYVTQRAASSPARPTPIKTIN